MRYNVVYLPVAEDQLADLWIRAADRQAVSDASDRIDLALRDNPDTKGKSLRPFRVFEAPPLSVLYHVDPGDLMVRIIQVRRIK